MAKQLGRVFVIGISGTTNSGKTTLVKLLRQDLPGLLSVHQDEYYLVPGDPRLNSVYLPELDHHNWEDFRSLEMDRMVSDLRTTVSQLADRPVHQYILVDGFSIFAWSGLCEMFDLKYFLHVDKKVCAERRQTREYDPPDVPGYFEKIVWPEHLRHLNQIKPQQDIVYLQSNLSSEEKAKRIIEDLKRLEQTVNKDTSK